MTVTMTFHRKGGAGKSTALCQFAAILAEAGRKVAIYDRDPIGTAGNWCLYREAAGRDDVTFVPLKEGEDPGAKIEALREKFDDVLVDLPGGDSKDNRSALQHADQILIPFQPSNCDLDQLDYVSQMFGNGLLKKYPHIKLVFFFNRVENTKGEESEARALFAEVGLRVQKGVLKNRKIYRESMGLGLGVIEMRDQKAAEETRGLFREIFGKVGDTRRHKAPLSGRKGADGPQLRG